MALKCHNLVSSSDCLVNNEMIIISLINIKDHQKGNSIIENMLSIPEINFYL